MTEGYHPAQSISATQPWDHVEIDLVGPVPTSSEGHTYIFSAADVMSAYVVLKALHNKTMECVARALWEIISEYGTMKILQSDNGTEFVNQVMHELTNMYGIDHRLITPYLPRANGLVERKNKEIVRSLRKQMKGAAGPWHKNLPAIQLALNVKTTDRTKSAPFTLMYGRPFNEFWDYSHTESIIDTTALIDQRLQHWQHMHDIVYPATTAITRQLQTQQRDTSDAQRNLVSPIPVGSSVMAIDATRASKWDPVYEGPFVVAQRHPGGTYTLQDATGAMLERRRTIDMLKIIPPQHDQSMAVPSGEGGNLLKQVQSVEPTQLTTHTTVYRTNPYHTFY